MDKRPQDAVTIALHSGPYPYPNRLILVRLTFGFFCVFFAFTAQQNLMAVILESATGTDKFAYFSLAIVYAAFMPSCLILPTLLKTISPWRMLPVGTACYALYALAASAPATVGHHGGLARVGSVAILFVAASLIGASAAVVWICQGHIIAHISPQGLLNRYVSFFFTITNLANILNPLVAGPALKALGPACFFVFLFLVSGLGTLLVYNMGPPGVRDDIPAEPLLQPAPLVGQFVGMLADPFRLLRGHLGAQRIYLLASSAGLTMNAFVSAGLPRVVATRCSTTERLVSVLALVGGGRFLASAAYGSMADRLGRRSTLLIAGPLIPCAVLMFVLEALSDWRYPMLGYVEIPFVCIGALLQGLGNGLVLCSLSSLISSRFQDHDRKHALALQHFGGSLCAVVGFVFMPVISVPRVLALVLIVFVIGLWAVACCDALFVDSVAPQPELAAAVVGAAIGGTEEDEALVSSSAQPGGLQPAQ